MQPNDVILVGAIVAALVAIGLQASGPKEARRPLLCGLFGAACLTILVAGRWPMIMANRPAPNPDEAQLIAGALTLIHDPVFWRSVDGTSHGPLDQWPLVLLHAAGAPLDYRTARVFAVGALAVSLFFVAAVAARRYSVIAAWAGALPVVVLLGSTRETDFVHCSTEQVPLAFWTAALWVGMTGPASRARAAIFGALLTAIAMAKPQAGPMGAALGLAWLCERILDARRGDCAIWPQVAAATLGGLAVLGLCLGPTILAGYGGDIWLCYYLANKSYVAYGDWTLANPRGVWAMSWFFVVFASVVAAAMLANARGLLRDRFAWYSATFVLIAWTCIVLPGKGFPHYWLLILPPAALAMSISLEHVISFAMRGFASPSRQAVIVAALALIAVIPIVGVRTFRPASDWDHTLSEDREDRRAIALIRSHSGPDDALAVWGWRYPLFVGAQRRQATREAHIHGHVSEWPYRDLWRERFLTDLERTKPAVFADAVGGGPGGFVYFDRTKYGHEIFPELAAWVARNYTLVGDTDGVRIYRRNADAGSSPLADRRKSSLRRRDQLNGFNSRA